MTGLLKSLSAAALALMLSSGAALASFERLDSVRILERDHTRNTSLLFEGRLDRIAFRARERAVHCDVIRIHFRNGGDQEIRNKRFRVGDRREFNLNGNNRNIVRVQFNCEPVGRGRGPATLVVLGER